ncbi:MAG: hypothetical protein LBU34_11140 [Planctomycetaceae bacterium]|jgi:hypothetical protein|nr:hypothetical protein [Planctomycetaceae bacterium]
MVDIKDVQVLEPFDAISFSQGLKNHVIKHVFQTGEHWQEFFRNKTIDSALFGYQCNGKSDADFLQLCHEYEKLASDILLKLCTEIRWHFHFLTKKEYSKGKPMFYQTIEAIDIKRQIKVVAESFVRKGKDSPYIVCSVFRYWCKDRKNGESNSLRKYIDKRKRAKTFIRNDPDRQVEQTLLADHWGEE